MRKPLRGIGFFAVALTALPLPAAAQSPPPIPPAPIPGQPSAAPNQPPPVAAQPPSIPVCARLEGQLAVVNRGANDPARLDVIKRSEDAVAKQQAELDRLLVLSKKQGCEGGGFFALFTGRSPACQPLNVQVQQMRDNLDRAMSDLERLKSGNTDQESQRRALIGQLAGNNCGPQYRAAAAAQPSGFLDALFSGHLINPGGEGAPSGTYHTVCVRTCDGYYFPVSYSTVPSHFPEDARACQRECPATEAFLYTYRNPGEEHRSGDVNQRGALYRAAERIPLSQRIHPHLLVPPTRADLGGRAQGRRQFNHARKRRYRRDRSERQGAIATASAERHQTGQTGSQRRKRLAGAQHHLNGYECHRRRHRDTQRYGADGGPAFRCGALT